MREMTEQEFNSIEESGPLIAHWLDSEMSLRERKAFYALSLEERTVAKFEYLKKHRAESAAKLKAELKKHPPLEHWVAPDTLSARIEGSMNDADAIVAALREHWDVPDKPPGE